MTSMLPFAKEKTDAAPPSQGKNHGRPFMPMATHPYQTSSRLMIGQLSLRDRIVYLIDYEPTWFQEFCGGLGVLLWSYFALNTRDYTLSQQSLALPLIGLCLAPLRWALLLRLWWAPRMLAAAICASWWAWLLCGAARQFGLAPTVGLLIAAMAADLLTMTKYSLACARELTQEITRWRQR